MIHFSMLNILIILMLLVITALLREHYYEIAYSLYEWRQEMKRYVRRLTKRSYE